jgi:hypothetical protein
MQKIFCSRRAAAAGRKMPARRRRQKDHGVGVYLDISRIYEQRAKTEFCNLRITNSAH